MRRWFVVIVLALVALPALATAQDRSFVWQRIESDVAVQQDGRLRVTETLTLRYQSGPFTFAYRDMPTDYLDRVSNITVRDAERAYTPTDDDESETPWTFYVSDEARGQRVRWVYPPTSNTTRTFTVAYDVAGAVTREGDTAQVRWPVVFADRDEVVETATARVRLPGAVPAEQIAATFANGQGTIQAAAGEAVAQVRNIAPGQDVYAEVQFPGSVVTSAQPAWRAAQIAQAQYNATLRPIVDLVLATITGVLVLLLGALTWRWWRANRDPRPPFSAASSVYAPPEPMEPALVARLLGNDNGALQSTLFDLANRGYLRFEETPGERWHGQQITAIRTGKPINDLKPFEQTALDALFGHEPQVALRKRQSALVGAGGTLKTQHNAALLERGYLTTEGLARRGRGFAIGWGLLFAALLGTVPAILWGSRYSWWLPVLVGAVWVFAITWFIMAALVHGLSQQGAHADEQWRAYGAYIAGLQPTTAPPDQFSRLLPYAVALGVGINKLTNAYKQSAEPLPAWYQPHTAGTTLAASAATVLLLRDWSHEWNGFNTAFVAASASDGGSGGGGGGGGSGGGGAG